MSVCSFVQSQSAPSCSQSPSSSSQPSNLSALNEKPILTLKTSPKQVLMLNSSRLSVSPGSQASEHTTKKSPTILILSKPKNELGAKPVAHKPPKSSSNLISSYFNKQNSNGHNTTSAHQLPNMSPIQFMPNSKPITLIPIGKLAANSNASSFNENFNSLIPIETIEISTATIEINSTNEPSVEPKTEAEPALNPPVEQEPHESQVDKKPESAPNAKIDVTRCICQMDHDDGFMICCDSCLVWQHIACMEVNKKKIPDKFYCEKCNPRAINAQRARQIQEKFVKNLSKNMSNKLKNRRHSNSSSAATTPAGDADSVEEPVDENSALSPVDSEQNEFKRHKKRLKSRTIREEFEIKKSDDTDTKVSDKLNPLDIGSLNIAQNAVDLLKLAKVKSSKKSDETDEIKYRVKLTQAMQKDRIVCEYAGQVLFGESDISDCYNYTFKIPIATGDKPSSSAISSSSTANLTSDNTEIVSVCIDSSKVFNNSRYIRKSCKYNTKLVPVKDTCGNLKFFIQTIEAVGKNCEIFLAPDQNNVNNSVCLCEGAECELRTKLNCRTGKKSLKKPERRLSAHSPPPTMPSQPSHEDSLKCLSREDRKLASYMRVIEKLEKQVKRKKETKSRDHSDGDKSAKETSEKENEKNKKNKAHRPSLLSQHEQSAEPVDQEIASINERPAADEDTKSHVKSPDYSFVNLSMQPRHTLNLLQRNLSSDERFSPALEPLENNKTFLTKSFFHPKKHWLKTCCSNENTQSSPSKSESSQPPKKRRFVVDQSSSMNSDHSNHSIETNKQEYTPPPLFTPDQFYLNYLQPAAILNAPYFAPSPIYGSFNPYAALSLYQNLIPAVNQPGCTSINENTKKKVSLAEYRQRKECVKTSDSLFESISSSKSSSNDDSLCELDVYPTEEKKSRHSSCSSCSSRCTRNASLSDISDVSSVRSRSPSTSSQRSHSSRFESYQQGVKRKHRSCSTSRLQLVKSRAHKSSHKRSSSLNRPTKVCRLESKCLNKHSLSKSFGSCSSSLSIYSSNDVSSSTAKAHL